jgi:signal transduction histidine kinase
MSVLQRHPRLRQALVVAEQFLCALVIYTLFALSWQALGDGRPRPGVVTVLVATAVVAVVLAWSRRPFERAVNWLAFGRSADGYELATSFLRRISDAVATEEVLPRLAETVARTVGSRRGEVRVWLADGNTWRQTWPEDTVRTESDVTVALHHGGDLVGQMVAGVDVAELSPADHRLLQQLAGPAGLALSTVRLTHALRQQAGEIEATAAEVRASRERIVDARRGEQAQIRRLLATRVEPHLQAAADRLADGSPPAATSLEAASEHVTQALAELRILARGLYPARLAGAGLQEALRGWAEQHTRRLSLSGPDLNLPSEIGTAVYFCAVTALSGASDDAAVAMRQDDDLVHVEVRASHFGPSSLHGLADRTNAFGGTLVVSAPPDASVEVEFPLTPEELR